MGVVTSKLNPKNPKGGKTDWTRVDALSDAEIRRAAKADPDAPLLSKKELSEMERVPDVRSIRKRLGLSQAQFARRFHLSVATVRDWEQGRFEPDQASKTLLRLIERIPRQVEKALSSEPRSGTDG
jgi:putative transcriptional regulator